MKKSSYLKGLLLLPMLLSVTACDGGSSISSSDKGESGDNNGQQGDVWFKIYYYNPNQVDNNYNNLWFWPSDSEDKSLVGGGVDIFNSTRKFDQTGDWVWKEAIIYKNMEVDAQQNWSLPDGETAKTHLNEKTMSGGLIIRTRDGSQQTGEITLDFDQLNASADKEVFFVDKGQKVPGTFFYSINDVPSYSVTRTYFSVNSLNKMTLNFETKNDLDFGANDMKIGMYRNGSSGKTYAATNVILDSNIRRTAWHKYSVDILNMSTIDPTWKWDLTVTDSKGSSTYDIDMQTYYSTQYFEKTYTPSDDLQLGSFIRTNSETGQEETVFRVWTPFATEVRVGIKGDIYTGRVKMNKISNGVWEYVYKAKDENSSGNLGGHYYTFSPVIFGKQILNVADPYGESANTNGKESMVVDWNSPQVDPGYNNTDFANSFGSWNDVKPSTVSQEKASVSELHVRDFSSDPSWTGKKENVGKFMALTEKGLTLKDDNTTKIGLDYIEELAKAGLSHIQLLPIYDFASVDETKLDDESYQNKPSIGIFNWGYDPQSFNSPEGSYATNSADGYTRVRELRAAIQALSSVGVGTVMDVVYNHMPSQKSTTFDKLCPDYYFLSYDASGAGATMLSTRKMYKKFMVDSTKMWAENYKLSGFRFDLMGILSADSMMAVSQGVREINPNALMYGEGWQMFSDPGTQGPSEMMASQKNLQYFGTPEYSGTGQVETGQFTGAFNDNYRDALNGGTGNITNKGFMQNAYDLAYTSNTTEKRKMYYGLLGTNPWESSFFNDGVSGSNYGFDAYNYSYLFTGGSVNYTECHDNLTAWDKLYATMKNETIADQLSSLGNLINSVGVGVTFYQFGQEFGRSKLITDEKYLKDEQVLNSAYTSEIDGKTVYFSHNSYNTGDKVNSIKWNLAKDKKEMVDAFKASLESRKLIASVKSFDQLSSTYFLHSSDYYGISDSKVRANTFAQMVKASDGETLYFFVNPTKESVTVNVPYGAAATVYKDYRSGLSGTVQGQMTLQPTSFVVLKGK